MGFFQPTLEGTPLIKGHEQRSVELLNDFVNQVKADSGTTVLTSLEQKSIEYVLNRSELKIGEDFRLDVQNDNRAYELLINLNKGITLSQNDKTFLENFVLNNFGSTLASLNRNDRNQIMDSIVIGKIIAVADNYGSGKNYPYLAGLIQSELAADESPAAAESMFSQIANVPGLNALIMGERLNYLLNDDVIGLNRFIPQEIERSRNDNLNLLREIGDHLNALKTAEISHTDKLTHINALRDFVQQGVEAGVISETIKFEMYKEIMALAGINGNQLSLLKGVSLELATEESAGAGYRFTGESYVEGMPLLARAAEGSQSSFMSIRQNEILADYRTRIQKTVPAIISALYRMSDNIEHQWSLSDIDPSGIVLQTGREGDVTAVINIDNAGNKRINLNKPFDLLLLINKVVSNDISPVMPETIRNIAVDQDVMNMVFKTVINEANGIDFISESLTELDSLLIDPKTGMEKSVIQTDDLFFGVDDYRNLRNQLRDFVDTGVTNLTLAQTEFEINAGELADSISQLILANGSVNQPVITQINQATDIINNAQSAELRDIVMSKLTSDSFIRSLAGMELAVIDELYRNLFDNLSEQAVIQLYNKLDSLIVSQWNFMELPVVRDIRAKVMMDIAVDIKPDNFLEQINENQGKITAGSITINVPDGLGGYLSTLSQKVTALKAEGNMTAYNRQFDFLTATVLAASDLNAIQRKSVINGMPISFERQRRLTSLLDVLIDNANPAKLYWTDADRQLFDLARTVGINLSFDRRQEVLDKNFANVMSSMPITTIASDLNESFEIVQIYPNVNNPYFSLEHQTEVGVDVFSAYHAQENAMTSTLQTAGFHGYFETDITKNGHVSWLIDDMFPVTVDQFSFASQLADEQPSRENFHNSDVSLSSYQNRMGNVINEIRNPLLEKYGYVNVVEMLDEYEDYYVYMSAQDRAVAQAPVRLKNYLTDFMNAFTRERAVDNARLRMLEEYTSNARGTAELRAKRIEFNEKVENGDIQIQADPFIDRSFNEVLSEGAVKGIVVLVTDPNTNLDVTDPASVFNDSNSNFYKAKQRAEQENIPLVLVHHYNQQQAQQSVMPLITDKVSALNALKKLDQLTPADVLAVNGLLKSLADISFTRPDEFNSIRQELLWWAVNAKDDNVRQTAWSNFTRHYSKLDNLLEQEGDGQIRQDWQISHGKIYDTDSLTIDIAGSKPASLILTDVENLLKDSNVIKRMLFSIYGLTGIQASSINNINVDYLDKGAVKNAHLVSVTLQGHPEPYRFVLNQRQKEDFGSLINSLQPVVLNEQAGTEGLLPVFVGVYNEFDGNTESDYNFFVESYLEGLPFVRLNSQQASLDMIHKFDSETAEQYFDRMAQIISAAAGILYRHAQNASFQYNPANITPANIVMHMNQDNRYEGGLANVQGLLVNEDFFDTVLYMDMILKSGVLKSLEPEMRNVYLETYLAENIFDGIVNADQVAGMEVLEQTRDSLNEFILSRKDTPKYETVKKIGGFERTLEQLVDFANSLTGYIDQYKADTVSSALPGDTAVQPENVSFPVETSEKLARIYGDLFIRDQQSAAGNYENTFTPVSNFEDLASQFFGLTKSGVNIPQNIQPLFDGAYLDNLEQKSSQAGLAILTDILKSLIDDPANPAFLPDLARMDKNEISQLVDNLNKFVNGDFSDTSFNINDTQGILQDLPAESFVGERLNNALVSMNNGKPYTVINLTYDLRPGFGSADEISQILDETAARNGLTDSDVILIKTVSPLSDGSFNVSLNADTLATLRNDAPAIAYGTTFENLAFTFKKTFSASEISESNLSFSADLQKVGGLGSEFIRNEYAVYQMAGLSSKPVKSLTKELRVVSLLNREAGAEFGIRDHFEKIEVKPSNFKRFYSIIDLMYRVGMVSNQDYLKLFQARSANDFKQVKPVVLASLDSSKQAGETDTQSLLRHISEFNPQRARLEKVINIVHSITADPVLAAKYPQLQTSLSDVVEFVQKFRIRKDSSDYKWTAGELARERNLIENIDKYESAVNQAVKTDVDGGLKEIVTAFPSQPDVNAAYAGTAVFMKNALGGYIPLTGQVPSQITQSNQVLAVNSILKGMNMVQSRTDIETLKNILGSSNPLENMVKHMNSVPAQPQNELPVLDIVDEDARIAMGERLAKSVDALLNSELELDSDALNDIESLALEIEALGFAKAAEHIRGFVTNALEIGRLRRSEVVNERIAGNDMFMDFRTKINADFLLNIGIVYNGEYVFDFYSDEVEEHNVTVNGKQQTVLILRGKRVHNPFMKIARAQYIMMDSTYPLPGYPQGANIIYTENNEIQVNTAKRIIELLNMRKNDNPVADVLFSQIQDLSKEDIAEFLEKIAQVHEMKHFLDDSVKSPLLDNVNSAEASAVMAPLMAIIAKLQQDQTLTETERNDLYNELDSTFALEIINILFMRKDFMKDIMHLSARAPYQLTMLFLMAAVLSPEVSDGLVEKIQTGTKDNQTSDFIELLNEELGILADTPIRFSKKITDEFRKKYVDFVNENFPNKTERGKAIAEALKNLVDKLAQDERYGEFADMALWNKLNDTLTRKNVKRVEEKMDFNRIVQSMLKDKKVYSENELNGLISRSENLTPDQQRFLSNLNLIIHGMPLSSGELEYINSNPDDSWNTLLSVMNGWLSGQNQVSSQSELKRVSDKLGDEVAAWSVDLYDTKIANLFDEQLKKLGIDTDVKLIEYALSEQLKVTPLGFVNSFERVFSNLDTEQERNRVLESILLRTNKQYSDLEQFAVAVTGIYPQALMRGISGAQEFFERKSVQSHLNEFEMERISTLATRLSQSFTADQPLDKSEARGTLEFMLALLRSPAYSVAQTAVLDEIIAQTSDLMGVKLGVTNFNLLFKDSTGYLLSEIVAMDIKLHRNTELAISFKLSDKMMDSFDTFSNAVNLLVSSTYLNSTLVSETEQQDKSNAMQTISDLLAEHPDSALDMIQYLDSFVNNNYSENINSFINRFDNKAVGETFTSMVSFDLIESYSQLTNQPLDIITAELLSRMQKAANDDKDLLSSSMAVSPDKSLQRKSVENINNLIKENIEKGNAVRVSLSDLKNNIAEDLINPLFEGEDDQIVEDLSGLFTGLTDNAKTELMVQLSDPMSKERLKKSLVLGLDVLRSSKMINEIDDFSLTVLLDWEGDFYDGAALSHVGARNKSFYLNLSTLMYIAEMDPEEQAYSKRVLQAVYEHEYRDYQRGEHADDIGKVDPVYFQDSKITFKKVDKFWSNLQNRPKEVKEQRVVDGDIKDYFKIQPKGLPEVVVSPQFMDEMGVLSAGKAMALLSRAAALNRTNLKKLFANENQVVLESISDFEDKYGKDKLDLRRFSSKIPMDELGEFNPLALDDIKYADQLKNLEFGSDFFIVTPVFNLLSRDDPDLMENILKKAHEAGYLDKLVVLDDASTDGTQELLKRFNRRYNVDFLNNKLQDISNSLGREGITAEDQKSLRDLESKTRTELASWENYINPETGEQVYDFNMVLRDENGHRTGAIRDAILGLYSLAEHGEINKLPEKLFIMDGDSYMEGEDIAGAMKDAANMLGNVEKDGNRIIANILPLSTSFANLPKGSTLLQKINFLYLAWLRSMNTLLAKSVPGGGGGYLVPYLVRALSQHSGIFETDDAELSGLLRDNKHSKFKFFGRRDFRVITDMPETWKGKWIQARRWSGGMFQLMRKGTKLPKGMKAPVIVTSVLYGILGPALIIVVGQLFGTILSASGLIGLITGATPFTWGAVGNVFSVIGDFMPLLYGAMGISYILFVIPLLVAGKHATRYEKFQSLVMAPIMGLNFFVSSFIASFYEFFAMAGDFIIIRPYNLLKPVMTKPITLPVIPRLIEEFNAKYVEPSKWLAVALGDKLREDPAFLVRTSFISFLGAFFTGLSTQRINDSADTASLVVNVLLTGVGFLMGFGVALWDALPDFNVQLQRVASNKNQDVTSIAKSIDSDKSLKRKSVENINTLIQDNIEKGNAVRVSLSDLKNNIAEDLINPLFEGEDDQIVQDLSRLFTDLPDWSKNELMVQLSDPMSKERLKKSLILGLDILRSSKIINEIDDFSLTVLLDWEGDFYNGAALSHVGARNKSFYLNLSTLMYIAEMDPEEQAYSKRVLQAVYEHEYRDYQRGEHADDIGKVDPVYFQDSKITFKKVDKFWSNLQNRPKEVKEQRVVDGDIKDYFKIQPKGLPEVVVSPQFMDEMGVLSAGKAMALLSQAAALNRTNLKKLFANENRVVLESISDFEDKYGKDKLDLRRFSSKIPMDELGEFNPLALDDIKYSDQLKNLEFGSDFFIVTPVFNLLSRDDPDLMENILKKAHEAGYLDKLVVVDDASTDGTQELLKRFNRRYNVDLLNNKLQDISNSLAREGITAEDQKSLRDLESKLRTELASWENYVNPETGEQVYDFNMVLRDENGHRTGAIRDAILGLYSLAEHGEINKLPEKLFIMDGDSYMEGEDIAGAMKDAANMLGNVEKDGNRIIANILPLSTSFANLPKDSTLLQKVNFLYLAWLRSMNTLFAKSVPGGGGGYLVPYLVRALSQHSGIFETDDAELSGLLRSNQHSKFKFFSRRDFRVITDMPETWKGKWIQARRWSGGMFQLMRKGTNLPKGMKVPVIITTILYSILGPVLAVVVGQLFGTILSASGLIGLITGATPFTWGALGYAFSVFGDFMPLIYGAMGLSYVLFVTPVLLLGKHATMYEKIQTVLLAPVMGVNFFISSFVASFYEFFAMVGDFLIVRPFNKLKPVMTTPVTLPVIPQLRAEFHDKYLEPSRLMAVATLHKLKEDPAFLVQTSFIGFLGAFFSSMMSQYMYDSTSPGVTVVNLLMTVTGFSMGLVAALWNTVPELIAEGRSIQNNDRNNPSLARSNVRPDVDVEISKLIENGDAIRIELKDIALSYKDVDGIISGLFDKDLSNEEMAARLQKALGLSADVRSKFAAKLADPEYRVKLQNALSMALSVIRDSEYRDYLKDFSLTLLLDEEGVFYRGDALAHAGLSRKTIYLNLSTLEHISDMESEYIKTPYIFGRKVLQTVIEHEFRDWARGMVARKGTRSIIWNSLLRRLYKNSESSWFRSWVELYKNSSQVTNSTQNPELFSAHQKDIGRIDPVKVIEHSDQVIDFAKVDAFWKHLQKNRDPKINYENEIVSLKTLLSDIKNNTNIPLEERNTQIRKLIERYVSESSDKISKSVFINYDLYLAIHARSAAVGRVKADAVLHYETILNELVQLSEMLDVELTDIIEDIKTLLLLYNEFNYKTGSGYYSKDEKQADQILRALDYNLLKRVGVIKVVQELHARGINVALFLNAKLLLDDDMDFILAHNLKVVLDELKRLPDDIISYLPNKNNAIVLAARSGKNAL